MYQDVLFSLYIPRVGERLLCFSHTTGKRTKTDFVLSCHMAPKFPGSDCYLIQTLDGLRYAVLVPPTPKEAAMSPSNAKAVAATTAFVLPKNGQISLCFHRTTNPTPVQGKTRLFPEFPRKSNLETGDHPAPTAKTARCGKGFLSFNWKVVAQRLGSMVDKILKNIWGHLSGCFLPSQPKLNSPANPLR